MLFVDAGWWVAGPYPPKFDWAIDSDGATDPSQPPPPSGSEPRRWQRVATQAHGLVDMTPHLASLDKNVAGYAMAIVYSAIERQAVLLIGTDDLGRVLLNGRQILDSNNYTPPGSNAVEVTLKQGRNILVARVVNTVGEHGFYLRIGDKPGDFLFAHFVRESWPEAVQDYLRATAEEPSNLNTWVYNQGGGSLAQTGRFKDAIAAYKQAIALNPGFFWNWHDLVRCELAVNDLKSYQHSCRDMIQKFGGTKDLNQSNTVAWAAALVPGAVADYRKVLHMMQPLINAKNVGWAYLNTYGALLYRNGEYQGAINFLRRSIDAQKGRERLLIGFSSPWPGTARGSPATRKRSRPPRRSRQKPNTPGPRRSRSTSFSRRPPTSSICRPCREGLDRLERASGSLFGCGRPIIDVGNRDAAQTEPAHDAISRCGI